MKLNWGTSIAIFYSLFVIIMISAVMLAIKNETHLVQENYYDHDLNYEAHRQKRLNAKDIQAVITTRIQDEQDVLCIELPASMADAEGSVTLFRPSNKYVDQSFPISLDEKGKMQIPLDRKLSSGLWRVKLDWQDDNRGYFKETSIVL